MSTAGYGQEQILARQMQALEETLLHDDHSGSTAVLERLLAPDFIEVNPAGGRSPRPEVLRWLQQKDPAARWHLQDLEVQELSPELRLVTYHALQVAPQRSSSKGARHASLWSFNGRLQCWQLRFHQSTRVL
jgi:hypothetical protein